LLYWILVRSSLLVGIIWRLHLHSGYSLWVRIWAHIGTLSRIRILSGVWLWHWHHLCWGWVIGLLGKYLYLRAGWIRCNRGLCASWVRLDLIRL
uniref:NADH:ubiquinone reductase (H(+)-translocating) n=1 Tax=Haemonchus placei TaxID=6290 RepID=A0A158QNW8_HAEPC